MKENLLLKKTAQFKNRKGPVLLIIMDGVGIGKEDDANAVFLAKTPTLDSLTQSPLHRTLLAHGKAVGMPSDEDMGNSEVGHNALGSGRIVDQGASLVENAIQNKQLFLSETWKTVLKNTKSHKSTLHFLGLLSDGNVHAHIRHLKAMIIEAVKAGQKRIRIHILLDGRDVGERTGLGYINDLEQTIQQLPDTDIKIASGGGRMITTMDRYDADWSIVERGWNTHVLGIGRQFPSAKEAVTTLYNEDANITDQYISPFVIADKGTPIGTIEDNDSVILFNFRGDRAIEISRAFDEKQFTKFDRKRVPNIFFCGMMQYDGDLKIPAHFLVNPPAISNPVSDYLCANGIRSFAISETQKYGHVTYFWNGNRSGYIDKSLETYVEITSDLIPFDQVPKMKAYEITAKTIELLESGNFDFGRVNFPNGDMVGHTGSIPATITSVEATDECVQKLIDTVNKLNGITVILADHGNADEMYTVKNGVKTVKTSHTLNPVPFAIVDNHRNGLYALNTDLTKAGLANVAATICNLLGFEAPKNYENSLIQVTEPV